MTIKIAAMLSMNPSGLLSAASAMKLGVLNWMLVLLLAATPLVMLCGIYLKYRESAAHTADPKVAHKNLRLLAVYGIFGIMIAFEMGWAICRIVIGR